MPHFVFSLYGCPEEVLLASNQIPEMASLATILMLDRQLV